MADICDEAKSLGVVSLGAPQSLYQGTLVHAAELLHSAGVAQGFQATHIHDRFQETPVGGGSHHVTKEHMNLCFISTNDTG